MHGTSGHASLPTPGGGTHSFWHKDPSSTLLGHRTTKLLPSTTEVVIIGSGISGAFAAWNLLSLRPNTPLLLLEAREACWGATGRNGGHCQPKLYSNGSHIGRFELRNFMYIRDLINKFGIECDWQEVEACHGYYDEELFYPAVAAVEALKALDPELGERVRVITKRSEGPSMKDLRLGAEAVGAVVTRNAASLWPYKLVAWILETLLKRHGCSTMEGAERGRGEEKGFNLQTNTPVTHLQRVREGWVVHTGRGMVSAKQVLLCTNAYTSFLLPAFNELIVPVKEEMTALVAPPSISPGTGTPLFKRNSYCFYSKAERERRQKDDYLVQRPFTKDGKGKQRGGQLMFGGGREFAKGLGVGTSDDSFVEMRPVEYLRSAIAHELDLENNDGKLAAEWVWSGIMGFSRDLHPWVGAVPEQMGGGEGLYICAGFSGHGMPNASLCAKAVVKTMLNEEIAEGDLPEEFALDMERTRRNTWLQDFKD